jgi:hypothetical protein
VIGSTIDTSVSSAGSRQAALQCWMLLQVVTGDHQYLAAILFVIGYVVFASP